jgi:prevent-host-death family protein
MGIHVNIGEAKTRLSELVAASLRGEEVILAKAGKPVARIEPLESALADEKERVRAERAAKMKAFIGSFKGRLGPNAGDILLEPEYTDEEIDNFSQGLGD